MAMIFENMVLEWYSEESDSRYIERILWLSPNRELVFSIEMDNEKALPIMKTYTECMAGLDAKLCKQIDWINDSVPLTEDTLEEEHVQLREKAWEAIKDIVMAEPDCFDSKLRGVLVREAQSKTGLHKSTIYRYIRRYWQGGKIKNALLPFYNNCGKPGADRGTSEKKRGRPRKLENEPVGINIDEDVRQLFRSGIRLFYNSKDKAPLTRVYQKTLEKFFVTGYRQDGQAMIPILPPDDKLPTFGQFRYWASKEMDLEESLIKRLGKKKFETSFRPILGSSTQESFGPGSRFQIDATIADVFLVSEYRRDWVIGRPVIYIVVDVFSRYIAGIYIGLEGPSWIGAMMALANTTADKVEYCAQYGIDIDPEDWICSHLPQKLTADRGELEGKKPTHLIDVLGVDVENASPYRADWKGIVEQQFRLLNVRSVRFVPGAITERQRERGQRDYRLDAKLTLREFTQIIIRNVLYHNNQHHMQWYDRNEFMIADEVLPIPRDLWLWGIINRNGRLKKQPENIVKLNLMYHGEATVTAAGIQFKGMHYGCDLALREQWFIKARAGKTWRVKVCYDPRTTNEIYLWLEEGRGYETCTLLDREERYRDKRFEEVEDLLEIEKYQGRIQEVSNLRAKIELDAHTKAIVDEASRKTDEAIENSSESKTQRLKNTRSRRSNEKELNRPREAFRLSETVQDQTHTEANSNVIQLHQALVPDNPKNEYVPAADKLSKIKAFMLEDGEEDE